MAGHRQGERQEMIGGRSFRVLQTILVTALAFILSEMAYFDPKSHVL